MTIVVDLRVGLDFSPSAAAFWEQFWPELARVRPTAKFIFIVPPGADGTIEVPNLQIKVIKSSSFGWLDTKSLITYLKEVKAERYISMYEFGFGIHRPEGHWFQKKDTRIPLCLGSFSTILAKEWQKQNKVSIPFVPLKPAYVSVTTSMSWTASESIKTRFTGGRDFFLFSGDISEKYFLIDMLKGFSLFKRWQQSNMQLVIAGYSDSGTDFFEDKLDTYKFKPDVVLLKNPDEEDIGKLTAAAYGIIYTCTENTMPFYVSRCLQTGTALIASDITVIRELTDAAAWLDNNNLQDSLANALKLLYRDENYKNKLVENGKGSAKALDATVMLEKSWEIISGN